jgi:hypothetical protein
MWQDLSYGKLTQDLVEVYEVICDEGGTESTFFEKSKNECFVW